MLRQPKLDLDLGYTAAQKMTAVISASSTAEGLQTLSTVLARQELQQRSFFGRALDHTVQTQARSVYTNDKCVVQYCALAAPHRDVLGLESAVLSYTLQKGRSQSVRRLLAIALVEDERRKALALAQAAADTTLTGKALKDKVEVAEWGQARTYPGFVMIGYDLFAKETNPFFLLNEVAVITHLLAHSQITAETAKRLLTTDSL
jgi:hypothetical protein